MLADRRASQDAVELGFILRSKSCRLGFAMSAKHSFPSGYYDEEAIAAAVARSEHRAIIGGMWDEIGKLQIEFLTSHGLKPWSKMVDIGCGCLRGGVHFIEYLEAGNYFGTDVNQTLLDAGYEVELKAKKLQEKLPRSNLVCDGQFNFSQFPKRFDFALAQSVFTHLPANYLQLCLARLAPQMEPSGSLHASFFIIPDDHPFEVPFDHPHGIKSFDDRDPYHYRGWQIRDFCRGLPWRVEIVGDWSHPRDQQMVQFEAEGGGACVLS